MSNQSEETVHQIYTRLTAINMISEEVMKLSDIEAKRKLMVLITELIKTL